jgi:hypothetical protein
MLDRWCSEARRVRFRVELSHSVQELYVLAGALASSAAFAPAPTGSACACAFFLIVAPKIITFLRPRGHRTRNPCDAIQVALQLPSSEDTGLQMDAMLIKYAARLHVAGLA